MLDNELTLIAGGSHSDERGTITFINDFDMQLVKRFYRIKHYDTSVIRGWRGHQVEQRWFHVNRGAFEVLLVQIDNWDAPNPFLEQRKVVLNVADPTVLHIPAGYATAIRAIVDNSELTVFADHSIEHAKNDDYLFPTDFFKEKITNED